MGRRFKGHVPQEMLEDQGVPGKLYFEEPQVVDIVVRRVAGSTKVITLDAQSKFSHVRCDSTRALRDFNRKEIVEYRMGILPALDEIKDYMRWAEIQGFANGTIVARRWCADWRWETPREWGMIVGCQAYTANTYNNETYAPFTVRWLDKGMSEEKCWAEDLYVVHQCLSKQLLGDIIEEQKAIEGVQ